MQDEVYRYNEERWEALVEAEALFTRPMLDLDVEKARTYLGLERLGIPGDLTGRKVLCLAGGGGQQSAAFALLGADVTVFDISSGQLERDRLAAEHYGVGIRTVHGDMRDLSGLDDSSFDLVWHPYSLTFVPDARIVFREVARVVGDGGRYYLMCANPFFSEVVGSPVLVPSGIDVLVARTPLPIPADGLDVTVLYDEPRALLLPASHPLAGKESVTAADFADEPLVACAGMAALWTGFWRLDPRPNGDPALLGRASSCATPEHPDVAQGQRKDLVRRPVVPWP
ncbi:methyltransferase domain-containing protein [Nonomuraea sp. NPDC004580]|uniref:methyltransferase domain-containing protein n=1 Tax=Nonomuraea sp. NPDC004580 TaxID=3154552 RepID=UPI00339EEA23